MTDPLAEFDHDCAIGRVEVESYDSGWAWRIVKRRWVDGTLRYDPLLFVEKVLP